MRITMTDKKIDWDAFEELRIAMKAESEAYEKDCDSYWNALSYEDKLMAFYSVVKRICKGELEDQGSYRWVLYEVFGFDFDSYIIGMECGFMDLHNAIDAKDYVH